MLASDDPTNEIGAAWAVERRLRMLLAQTDRDGIRDALWPFYEAAAAGMPEATPVREDHRDLMARHPRGLTEDVTNARTDSFNRIIEQTKRVACGFRTMDNDQRRIMSHIALTRTPPAVAA